MKIPIESSYAYVLITDKYEYESVDVFDTASEAFSALRREMKGWSRLERLAGGYVIDRYLILLE